jgi:hypothetical protein
VKAQLILLCSEIKFSAAAQVAEVRGGEAELRRLMSGRAGTRVELAILRPGAGVGAEV